MSYALQLEIPPLTQKDSPVSISVFLPPCKLSGVNVLFPIGCAGLVGVQAHFQTKQVLPFNKGAYYIANGQIVRIDTSIEIIEEPFELVFTGYNEDDTYPHTLYIFVDIVFDGDVTALAAFLDTISASGLIADTRV